MDLLIEEVLTQYNNTIEMICRRYAAQSRNLEWEDLAQECRIRIFTKWDQIQSIKPRNMGALVSTICKNCCLNVIRDTNRQAPDDVLSLQSTELENLSVPGPEL